MDGRTVRVPVGDSTVGIDVAAEQTGTWVSALSPESSELPQYMTAPKGIVGTFRGRAIRTREPEVNGNPTGDGHARILGRCTRLTIRSDGRPSETLFNASESGIREVYRDQLVIERGAHLYWVDGSPAGTARIQSIRRAAQTAPRACWVEELGAADGPRLTLCADATTWGTRPRGAVTLRIGQPTATPTLYAAEIGARLAVLVPRLDACYQGDPALVAGAGGVVTLGFEPGVAVTVVRSTNPNAGLDQCLAARASEVVPAAWFHAGGRFVVPVIVEAALR